jgi:hypothetical protein
MGHPVWSKISDTSHRNFRTAIGKQEISSKETAAGA